MENKPKKKPATPKRPSKKSPARKIGYLFAIAFMILFIYILRHLRQWGVDFLTEDFEKLLFYIELSIKVSIAAQVMFVIYDNSWFKHIIQGLTNVFGALSLIMTYVIYPFSFQNHQVDKWVKIGLLVVFIITVITIIVEIFKGIRLLITDPERE
jgi:hypothetical protein